MGYLFILLTTIFNLTKGAGSKKVSLALSGICNNTNITIMRNVFCAVIGTVILVFCGESFLMPAYGFLICAVSGIFLSVHYIAWVTALKTDAFMLASAAANAGFIVSVLCGIIFFGETLSLAKGIGALLVLVAMYFMTLYQKSFGGMPSKRDLTVLFLVFFTAGASSAAQKWFTTALPDTSIQLFTYYTFVSSVLTLLIVRPLFKSDEKVSTQLSRLKPIITVTVVMSLCAYGATYFQTRAAALLDSVVVYPLSNGLNLTGSSLMAWALFKERPNKHSIIGAILVFCALVLSRF